VIMGPYRRLKDAGLLGSGASEQGKAKKAEGKKLGETKVDAEKAVTLGTAHPPKKEHAK